MEKLRESLLNAESLDLRDAAERFGEELPFLKRLQRTRAEGPSLLDRTQAFMDLLLENPPPEACAPERADMQPWWSAMPDAYLAAFARFAGASFDREPSARESPNALSARRLLRRLGVPFPGREHAVGLLANLSKAENLPRSGARAETYMRLACAVDVQAMWRLRRCELLAREDEAEQKLGSLDTFRHKMQQFGVFDRPWPPPVEPERLRDLGYEEPRELHRALNAARYFDLVAGMSEDDWYAERMKQELERPRGRLHLLVGPAASGKSSWAEDHLAHTAVVSSDRMRRELTGDPADQSQNYLVFQRCMDRVRERLRDGEEVTFDATNYDERLREMPVQAGRWCAAEIVSYFFDVGVEEALRRNRNRPREVPEDVVLRHYRRLQPPALYEADRHCVVAEGGEVSTYWPVGGV